MLAFTLIELLVTLAVAGTLAVAAAPSLTDFIRANRLATAADQLNADLLAARREAAKRNGRVLICVAAADGSCGTGTAWSAGWIVCYDINADGACDTSTATNPNPIRQRGAVDASLTLTGPATAARFNADGTQGGVGAATLQFTVAGTWSGSKKYIASISPSGNITLVKSS